MINYLCWLLWWVIVAIVKAQCELIIYWIVVELIHELLSSLPQQISQIQEISITYGLSNIKAYPSPPLHILLCTKIYLFTAYILIFKMTIAISYSHHFIYTIIFPLRYYWNSRQFILFTKKNIRFLFSKYLIVCICEFYFNTFFFSYFYAWIRQKLTSL